MSKEELISEISKQKSKLRDVYSDSPYSLKATADNILVLLRQLVDLVKTQNHEDDEYFRFNEASEAFEHTINQELRDAMHFYSESIKTNAANLRKVEYHRELKLALTMMESDLHGF